MIRHILATMRREPPFIPAPDPHADALSVAAIDFADTQTQAERAAIDCEDHQTDGLAWVRDPVLRGMLTRAAESVVQSGCGLLFRFADGSSVTATDRGIRVR